MSIVNSQFVLAIFFLASSSLAAMAQTPPINANLQRGADIAIKINEAIAALPATGGTVTVDAGIYNNLSQTIILDKSTRLVCSTPHACSLTWRSGLSGVFCSKDAQYSSLDGFALASQDTVKNSDNGLTVECFGFLGTHLSISGFGHDNFAVLSGAASNPIGANANTWHFESVISFDAKNDGFHIEGADSNVGQCIGCTSQGFGNHAFDDEGAANLYLNPNTAQTNLGGITAFNMIGNSTSLINPYCEGGSPSDAAGAHIQIISNPQFGSCAWSLSPSSKLSGYIGSNLTGTSAECIGGPENLKNPAPAAYCLSSGSLGPEVLALTDQKFSKNILTYHNGSPFRFLVDAASTTHFLNKSATPLVDVGVAASFSNNQSGSVTGITGTSLTVTYANPFPFAAFPTITPANLVASNIGYYISAQSPSSFTVTFKAACISCAINYSVGGY